MNPNMENALIWWLSQDDLKFVYRLLEESIQENGNNLGLPFYIVREICSAVGRVGRGRLWASYKLSLIRIEPWPKTPLSNILSIGYSGIPFWINHYKTVRHLPGIFTRLDLSRVWPCHEFNIKNS